MALRTMFLLFGGQNRLSLLKNKKNNTNKKNPQGQWVTKSLREHSVGGGHCLHKFSPDCTKYKRAHPWEAQNCKWHAAILITWQVDIIPCWNDREELAIVERQAGQRVPLVVLGVEASDGCQRALVHTDDLTPSYQHYHLSNSCRDRKCRKITHTKKSKHNTTDIQGHRHFFPVTFWWDEGVSSLETADRQNILQYLKG